MINRFKHHKIHVDQNDWSDSRSQVAYYTEVAISSAWLAAAFVAICPASQLVRAGRRRAAELSWAGPPLWLRQEDALEAIAHGCVGRDPSSVWDFGSRPILFLDNDMKTMLVNQTMVKYAS